MITVALHIEPFYPDFPTEWFRWALRMSRVLAGTGDWAPVIVVSERVRAQAEEIAGDTPRDWLAHLDVSAITNGLGLDGHALVERLHDGSCPTVTSLLADALRRTLCDRRPDLVITWSPAPFYREAFGPIPIVYSEYAFFCRPPFRLSWYLDPVAPDGAAFLARDPASILQALPFGPDQERWVASLRDGIRRIVDEHSPFRGFLAELRQSFRRLVLLPLQLMPYYLVASRTQMATSQEVIVTLSRQLPPDAALIVTRHPCVHDLSAEACAELERTCGNVRFAPVLPTAYGVSEYLAPYMDAIAAISSKVAFLALFYGRPFLSIDGDFGSFFAAGSAQNGLASIEGWTEPALHRRMLYWILTRYNIPEDVFFSEAWLVPLLERLAAQTENGGDPYVPFATDAELRAAALDAAARQRPPIRPGQTVDRIPIAVRRRLPAGQPVPLTLLRSQATGSFQTCRLEGPGIRGPAMFMSPGWTRIDRASPMADMDAAVISFDVLVDQTMAEWVPLVWTGDPAREWQKGRSLCIYYQCNSSNIVAAMGTDSATCVCATPPGSIAVGRWYSVTAYVLRAWSVAIIVVDGRIEGVAGIPAGALIPPTTLAVGDDPHFPARNVWGKVANLRTGWDWQAKPAAARAKRRRLLVN